MERREVHYQGQVQGVGFRYTVCQIARDVPVTGYVKNLADGRVQLVAEGEPADVDRFLSMVSQRMGDYIERVQTQTTSATESFDDFGVRHGE